MNSSALDLFKQGGTDEDNVPRWRSHYHDPTQSLAYAGLKNGTLGWSNLEWAQLGGNDRSWWVAYDYFLAGLTASDSAARETSLSNLFLTLGHLTHLLADMAVPAHVRDDAHALPDQFEVWCKSHLDSLNDMALGKLAYRHEFPPDNAIFALSLAFPSTGGGTSPYSPVSNLWDTNPSATDNAVAEWTWLRQNPRLTGLAEYASYNYLSDDTVFTDYLYPGRAEVQISLVSKPAKDGGIDNMVYFDRYASDNVLVLHLAATGLLYKDWETLSPEEQLAVPAHLDENCFESYASNLVPRAVSYGTALVNYFFRGKFGVTAVGSTLTVKNLYAGSAAGTIIVYADNVDGTRVPVATFDNVALAPAGQPGDSCAFGNFSPPSTQNNQYLLVFQGYLENQGGHPGITDYAVAGKVFPWTAPSLPSKITVGDNPRGLAVAPGGGKLYVANASSDTVSVIDMATGEVRHIGGVGSGPVDVAFTPDGTRAFVTNERGRSVTVIDVAHDNVVATIGGLASFPEEVAVTPDGRYAYVTHFSFRPLTRIDTDSLGAVQILSPQQPLQGIALHPAEPLAYLTYYTFFWRRAVGVLDRGGDTLLSTWPGPDINWSAALGEGNRHLFVANASSSVNTVSVYDTMTGQLEATLPGGGSPRGVAASPDGTKIYVANLMGDSVTVIEAATQGVLGTIPAGDGAYDVALSPDGRYLFVSNAFEDSISVISLDASGLAAAGTATSASPLMALASAPEEASWGTAILTGFPAGGRVSVDGEFPRQEGFVEGGYAVSFPAGAHTLILFYPDYPERTIPVSVGPGETVYADGQMSP